MGLFSLDLSLLSAELLATATSLLLKLFWILATSSVIITITSIPAPQAFKDAVRLSAARGKLWSMKPRALGPLGEASVPQAWFSHFYAIGSVCNALLLWLVCTHCPESGHQVLPLLMLQLHLVRRLLETVLLLSYPSQARMHLIAYVFGLTYYLVLPASLLDTNTLMALAALMPSSLVSAAPQLQQQVLGPLDVRAALLPRSWVMALGLLVFLGGNALQLWAHASLARLSRPAPGARPQQTQQQGSGAQGRATQGEPAPSNPLGDAVGLPGEDAAGAVATGAVATGRWPASGIRQRAAVSAGGRQGPEAAAATVAADGGGAGGTDSTFYVLPAGGLFEWVSCPHYLGELVVYVGLLGLSEGHVHMWLALAWVTVNLVLAADATQKWYRAAFPTYPAHRKALLPCIW